MTVLANGLVEVAGPWNKLGYFDIVSLKDDGETLDVRICPENGNGIIIISIAYIGYRKFTEYDLDMYSPPYRLGIYRSTESEFLSWAKDGAQDKTRYEGAAHYMIVTNNEILEYIGFDPPKLSG